MKIPFLIVLCISVVTLATPPSGIVLNQIVAQGAALDDISEKIKIPRDSDLNEEKWQLKVVTQGATDFYVQHIVVAPGGYSGWHTHPGLLIGTVVSGSIDFYDENCQKRSFTAGQVFTENTEVHAIINTGTVDADLSIAYLIKHGMPRRLEADAPACAPTTGIP
jgi:quercetin dioxygenase-like cupin family protein